MSKANYLSELNSLHYCFSNGYMKRCPVHDYFYFGNKEGWNIVLCTKFYDEGDGQQVFYSLYDRLGLVKARLTREEMFCEIRRIQKEIKQRLKKYS